MYTFPSIVKFIISPIVDMYLKGARCYALAAQLGLLTL